MLQQWGKLMNMNPISAAEKVNQTLKKESSSSPETGVASKPSKGKVRENVEALVIAIILALFIRAFVVQAFKIPSGSMQNTLLIGDYILVNKFAYGLRSPIGYYKMVNLGSPHRGDVIVFRYPEDPSIDYIKRVIGVPGDKIVYQNKQLWINGKKIILKDRHTYKADPHYDELVEVLGKVTHHILLSKDLNYLAQRQEYTVPKGKYFAMGDNRDNSEDSRFWGFVPDKDLKGRAFLIWWSYNDGIKWSRIGTIIH